MKHFLTFLFSVLLTGAFVSCGDDENTPEPIDPKTTLLINKNWRVTADATVTTTSAGVSTTKDNYADPSLYAACGKDDFIRFDENGVLTIDEGNGRCASNDPQTATGRWSWNDDRTVITFTDPCLCQPSTRSNLSGPADLNTSTLTVKQTYTENGNTNVRTVTYGSF